MFELFCLLSVYACAFYRCACALEARGRIVNFRSSDCKYAAPEADFLLSVRVSCSPPTAVSAAELLPGMPLLLVAVNVRDNKFKYNNGRASFIRACYFLGSRTRFRHSANATRYFWARVAGYVDGFSKRRSIIIIPSGKYRRRRTGEVVADFIAQKQHQQN